MTKANIFKELQKLGMSQEEIEEEIELMQLAGEIDDDENEEEAHE